MTTLALTYEQGKDVYGCLQSYLFKPSEGDLQQLFTLETASYPEDEAASFEALRDRIIYANDYFLVYKPKGVNGPIVGFVNGTRSMDAEIVHESMSTHYPLGQSLCIHSVVISHEYRRQGLGLRILRSYLQLMLREDANIKRILLLSKSHLLPFYISCGFHVIRQSPVHHGRESWFELVFDLVYYRRVVQYQVDAFTNEPFCGNGAAVCILPADDSSTDLWKQKIASENNQAETSFISPCFKSQNGDEYEGVYYKICW